MKVREWSKSEIDYGRKLLNSGLEGARSGREEFLHGESLAPFLDKSVPSALGYAVAGGCIGLLGSYLQNRHQRPSKTFAFGILGGAIGLCVGVVWGNRRLEASVVSAAWKNMGRTRDEHWLERNPIDYA
jgi:hypothetical protein